MQHLKNIRHALLAARMGLRIHPVIQVPTAQRTKPQYRHHFTGEAWQVRDHLACTPHCTIYAKASRFPEPAAHPGPAFTLILNNHEEAHRIFACRQREAAGC